MNNCPFVFTNRALPDLMISSCDPLSTSNIFWTSKSTLFRLFERPMRSCRYRIPSIGGYCEKKLCKQSLRHCPVEFPIIARLFGVSNGIQQTPLKGKISIGLPIKATSRIAQFYNPHSFQRTHASRLWPVATPLHLLSQIKWLNAVVTFALPVLVDSA